MMRMAMGQEVFSGMAMMAGRQDEIRAQAGKGLRPVRPENHSLIGGDKVEAATIVDARTKRSRRVEELRMAIAQGGYRVASKDIAEALMAAMGGRK